MNSERSRSASVWVRTVSRAGLSVLLLSTTACPGDDGSGDEAAASTTEEPSETESTVGLTSTGTGDPGSTGESTAAADSGTTDTTAAADETSIPEVAFDEVLAFIQANCSCHRGLSPASGMDLNDGVAYDSIVSVPSVEVPAVNRIEPGDPSQSYLYLKLIEDQASVGGLGARMPLGAPMLPPEDIDLVRFWILGGAQP